jgi:2-methylcitrate dehydratase PrpD
MSFGQTLAEYVTSVTLDKVPQRDIDVAKLALLDQIGVALAGVGEDPGVKVQAMIDRCMASEATVLGNPRKPRPINTA